MKLKTRLTRGLCAAVTAAMLVALIITPAGAASSSSIQAEIDELAGRKEDIQARMNDIQAEIESLDYEKANTLEKKQMLDRKNELAQQELNVIQEQIDILDGLVTNMQMDLDAARQEEEYQRERWLGRVRAMEEQSNLSYIEVLFNAASFSDFLTRLDMVNEVMTYDEELEEAFVTARENVEYLESEAETLFAENEANHAELETKKAQLEADIEAAGQLIKEMEANIAEHEEELEQERQTQADVEALIIEKEAELAAAKAAEQAARPPQTSVNTGNGELSSSEGGGSTGGAWMMWPSYTTQLNDPYGYRYHPISGIYKMHTGDDINASYGSSVWAAAGGTVILAGDNGGYGNCVMINHGNGYTTLYAHMSSIAVSVGQTVGMGDTVGYVGSTGNSTGPHLHFEVRASSTGGTIDPASFPYI